MGKAKVIFRSNVGGSEFSGTYFGVLKRNDVGFTLSYSENSEDGMINAYYSFDGHKLFVGREGDNLKSEYVFDKWTETSGFVVTGYGEIPLSVFTNSLSVEDKGGSVMIKADYVATVAGNESNSTMTVLIKCEGDSAM